METRLQVKEEKQPPKAGILFLLLCSKDKLSGLKHEKFITSRPGGEKTRHSMTVSAQGLTRQRNQGVSCIALAPGVSGENLLPSSLRLLLNSVPYDGIIYVPVSLLAAPIHSLGLPSFSKSAVESLPP